MPSSNFSTSSVVSWYLGAEKEVANVLEVVPYCDEHEDVWSPALAKVLLDLGSQLDSLWRHEATGVRAREINITHYFAQFGEIIGDRWVVFWADTPTQIWPFEVWSGLGPSDYAVGKYRATIHRPEWWWAYTKVKHDRLVNQKKATLKMAVHALGAVFLATLRSPACQDAVQQAGWLRWRGDLPFPFGMVLDEGFGRIKNNGKCNVARMVAESVLFSYPVGWWEGTKNFRPEDLGASHRFREWCSEKLPSRS